MWCASRLCSRGAPCRAPSGLRHRAAARRWQHPRGPRGARGAGRGRRGHTPPGAGRTPAGESSRAAEPAVRLLSAGPPSPLPRSPGPCPDRPARAMAGIAAKLARDREAAEGLGSHERAVKYLNQDYAELRDQCLEAGTLFQDPSFPALPSSLGFKDLGPYSSKTQGIAWKRPTVGSAGRARGRAGRAGVADSGTPRGRLSPPPPTARRRTLSSNP